MKRRLIFSIFSLLFSITASAQKTDSARVHFEKAFEEISGMLTGKNPLSFKRAVFLSENAYLDNRLSYSAFDFSIKSAAHYCQRMAENLPINHPKEKPLGVNYTIFQHITDTTKHISGKDTFDFLPFRYDFNDFSGQKSWESMFVTKLLRERTGNCRSLPYYYKILADECGVEAFLALAPNHIYIKHRDIGKQKEGWQRRVYNIELTNGSFPMDGWLMASGYITLDAIRSGYYLDTLSQSQAVAMCLFDLAKAYERKFGKRDEFVSRCVERVLLIHPANINALLLKTELLKDRYEQTKAPADYQNVEKHCSTLVANGYREMPLDMYLNWLFEVRAKGDAFVNVKHQPKKFDTQKGNPYKNDTTMKIHMQTLTDGRYDEFPEFAETTYVGSAVYDVYKKRIIGFIKRDTLYSETLLEPEVVSRWLSTDPVFHPYESPYVGFANNPVYFIDPNGTTVGSWVSQSGRSLGTDGRGDDNRVFVLHSISDNEPISKEQLNEQRKLLEQDIHVPMTNRYELPVTKSKLLEIASTAYAEASENQNEEEVAGIANVIVNHNPVAYGKGSAAAQRFLNTSDAQRNGTFMQSALFGAINAVEYKNKLGGKDYSGGATQWDGRDLLTTGDSHFRYQKAAYDDRKGIYTSSFNKIHVSNYESNVQKFLNNNKLSVQLNDKKEGSLWEVTKSYGQTIFFKEIK